MLERQLDEDAGRPVDLRVDVRQDGKRFGAARVDADGAVPGKDIDLERLVGSDGLEDGIVEPQPRHEVHVPVDLPAQHADGLAGPGNGGRKRRVIVLPRGERCDRVAVRFRVRVALGHPQVGGRIALVGHPVGRAHLVHCSIDREIGLRRCRCHGCVIP